MGRGVFAGRPYRKGEVIEVCPVIRVPANSEGSFDGLEYYVFQWGEGGKELAIALGFGSLYNHNVNANARFSPRTSKDDIVFRAERDIAEGEQIFVDYRWDEDDYKSFR